MNYYVNISKFEEHNQIKKNLLDKIDLVDYHNIDKDNPLHQFDNADKINKTDYWIDNRKFEYINLIYPLLDKHCVKVFSQTSARGITFTKIWFQQYIKGNMHGWHTHPNTHFTNIYFLELPSPKYKTQIKDLSGKLIDYDVNEGDIITFPGFLLHQAPLIESDTQKTILSFNIELI